MPFELLWQSVKHVLVEVFAVGLRTDGEVLFAFVGNGLLLLEGVVEGGSEHVLRYPLSEDQTVFYPIEAVEYVCQIGGSSVDVGGSIDHEAFDFVVAHEGEFLCLPRQDGFFYLLVVNRTALCLQPIQLVVNKLGLFLAVGYVRYSGLVLGMFHKDDASGGSFFDGFVVEVAEERVRRTAGQETQSWFDRATERVFLFVVHGVCDAVKAFAQDWLQLHERVATALTTNGLRDLVGVEHHGVVGAERQVLTELHGAYLKAADAWCCVVVFAIGVVVA